MAISLLCDLDPIMESSIKIDFEKFDGKKCFSIWKVHVEDLLVQHELHHALKNRSKGMIDRQWLSVEKWACSMIRGCLADSALYSMLEEKIPKGL